MAEQKGKRYKNALEKVDRHAEYEPKKAMELVKQVATANFDETIELHAKLGVNPKHSDQQVRGAVVLPKGTGKDIKVIAFAQGEKAKEAEEAGADFVGAEDLAEKIEKENWLDFDVAVATPDMMRVVGRLGRILGPRGLMPNPKVGTVTMDIGKAIEDAKAGKVEYRVDKTSIIHVPIGKDSFSSEDLFENFEAIAEALWRARPAAAKGRYFRSVTVTPTMGPGVKIDTVALTNMVRK